MKWFQAAAMVPALVSGIISAIDAYDRKEPQLVRMEQVLAAALALRGIVAIYYKKTPTEDRVREIVVNVVRMTDQEVQDA